MKNIYLFSGKEELMIKTKIDKLVSSFTTNQFNITSYDMQQNNVAMAIQDALTPPFLADNKVIIINNPIFLTKQKSEIEHRTDFLIDYLNNPLDTTILIINASGIEIDHNNEVYKLLSQKAELSETRELSDVEMKGWLKRKFGIAGKDISDEAVNEFFERIDWNLLVASNEFEKVLNYVGERENVTIDDVTKVVVKEIETDVFSLLRALEEGKKKKIILIYQDLVKAGNDPTKLLALVSKSLRETYNVIVMLEASYKQVDIAKTLGVSTGRAYYIIKSARSFKKENLEHLIVNLHDLDFKIKSGKVDKNTGFEMFLFGYGK